MFQRPPQLLTPRIAAFLIAFLLLGVTTLQADVDKVKIKVGKEEEKEYEVDFSQAYEETDIASPVRVDIGPAGDDTSVTVTTDFPARLIVHWKDKESKDGKCESARWVTQSQKPFELDRQSLLQCDGVFHKGTGYISIMKGDKKVRIVELRRPANILGDDLGIVLNIISRSRVSDGEGGTTISDKDGYRYFEGASFYASLSNLKSKKFRLIGLMSALDFREDVEFEAGLGIGLLYKPTGKNFVISISRGYNFMVADDGDPWFTMIGFGWNFNRDK